MLGLGMAKDKPVGMVNILMEDAEIPKDADTFTAMFEKAYIWPGVRSVHR